MKMTNPSAFYVVCSFDLQLSVGSLLRGAGVDAWRFRQYRAKYASSVNPSFMMSLAT